MSAAVAAILEGMPEPRDLRMHQSAGRCVITAGPAVLAEYDAGDLLMRNMVLVTLRRLKFSGQAGGRLLGVTRDYVAAPDAASEPGGAAGPGGPQRGGRPGPGNPPEP